MTKQNKIYFFLEEKTEEKKDQNFRFLEVKEENELFKQKYNI